jgi:signal transduction histidine kinase
VTFLLTSAAAAVAPAGGRVMVRTRPAGDRVVLRVEDSGVPVEADALARFFEPSRPAREGVNRLEVAACRAIARRLEARIEARSCPEGVAVVVELKVISDQ